MIRLRYYGDPALRQKAEPVSEITDEIRQLVSDMIQVMEESQGIGLAAPQVGVSLRLFVSNLAGVNEDDTLVLCEPYAYINPVLTKPDDMASELEEGCLSIPKLFVPVIRPISIHVEALDIEGNVISKDVEGFLARHIMHENDHLNGVLTIDRLQGKRRTELEPELRRIKKRYGKR